MTEQDSAANMPQPVSAIVNRGYAIWASEDVDPKLRATLPRAYPSGTAWKILNGLSDISSSASPL